ncbi:hypothetical protein [Bradyrhizobium sp. USDA 4452]
MVSGALAPTAVASEIRPTVLFCADPHHEVVEASRWARRLTTSGIAEPDEIAIVSASTGPWDDQVLALVSETGLTVQLRTAFLRLRRSMVRVARSWPMSCRSG